MANAYAAEAAAPEPPIAVEGRGEDSGKLSQQEAGYRMGNPMVSCGLCGNFTGSAGPDPYQCTEVEGDISPYGYCPARYTRQDNPFLPGTQASFTEQETPAEDAAPDEEPDSGPRLQIGNRSY